MDLSAAFKALLPSPSSLETTWCYPPWTLDALLGFSLSRAFPTSAMARPSPCLLSGACLAGLPGVASGSPCPRTSEYRSTEVVAFSLSRAPCPSEVFRLLRSHRFGRITVRGYGFPSGSRARYRSRLSLFDPLGLPARARSDRRLATRT